MKRFSTETKFIVAIFIAATLALVNYWFYLSHKQEQKVNILRLTERISVNIKHLPLYASLYVAYGDREYLTQLKLSSEIIEEAVLMLKHGGEYEIDGKIYAINLLELEIEDAIENFGAAFETHQNKIDILVKETLYETEIKPALESGEPSRDNEFDELDTDFDDVKPVRGLSSVGHKKVKEVIEASTEYLTNNNLDLLMANEILKESIVQQIDKRVRYQQTLAGVFMVGILLVSLYAVYMLHFEIIIPLQKVENATVALASGGRRFPKAKNLGDFTGLANALEKIQHNISEAISFAQSIGQGQKIEVDTKKIAQNPIVQSLVEMQMRLEQLTREEDQRQWSVNGIAQISDVLRRYQDQPYEVQSFEFIRALIKYLGCNQGGVYLINDDNPQDVFIELKACYAFDKKKYHTQRLNLRQGLVGQCIFEKDIIYLDEVPNEYLTITSGLGEANPRIILLAPVQSHDDILGAIELASFHAFKPHEITFVQTVTERLASSLLVYRNNMKTQKLLDNSIKLNHELQQREALLKQQTSELRLYQEELNIKIQELQVETNTIRNVIAAINKTNASIEFDLDGNILGVNDMFLNVMGYQREELLGKNERMLLPDDPKQIEKHKMMWESLKNGAYMSGEYQRVSRFGKEVWLNGTYNPIFDIDGRPYKVLQFAQFTTEEKERELEQTSRIGALSEALPLLDLDLGRKIRKANPVFRQLLQYEGYEFKNKNFFSYVKIDDELEETVKDIWNQITEQGISKSIVLPFYTSTGIIKYCYTSFNPIRNLVGKIYKVMVFMVDITIQKNLEISLLQKQEELTQFVGELEFLYKHIKSQKRELESHINMVGKAADIFELNPAGKVILISENLCKRLGKQEDVVMNAPFIDLLHAGQDALIFTELINNQRTEIHREVVRYSSAAEHDAFWGDTTIAPLLDENDNLVKYIGVIFDVTNQVLQEQQLLTTLTQERMRNTILQYAEQPWVATQAVLESILDQQTAPHSDKTKAILENQYLAILMLDQTGHLIDFNQKALSILGYENQEDKLKKMYFSELIASQDKSQLITISKMLKGDVLQQELTFKRLEADAVTLKCYTFPVFQEEDQHKILVFLLR